MSIKFLDEKPKKKIRFLDEAITEQDPFLPGKEEVEKRITDQPDLLLKGLERAKEIPATVKEGVFPTFKKAGLAGLETVGGLFQRAVAGVATPAARLQEVTGEPGFRPEERILTGLGGFGPGTEEEKQNLLNRLNFAKELGFDVLRGIKGERLTELGDIPRRAGVPEPISAFIGIATEAALIDRLVFRVLSTGLNKIQTGIGKFIKGDVPFKAATDVTLKASDDLITGLRGVKTSLGEAVRQTVQKVGGKVNKVKLKQIVKTLPDNAANKIKDKIFGLKFVKGAVDDSLENVWKFRQFLDDFLTSKDFIEATRKGKEVIKGARRATKLLMEDVDPRIKPVMDTYSKFITKFRKANKLIIDPQTGIVLERKLRSLFKPGAERGFQKTVIELIEFMPEAEDLIRTIVRFNRGQVVKKTLTGLGRTLGTVGLLRGAFRGVGKGGGDTGGAVPTPAK